jgi:hypothetical protein
MKTMKKKSVVSLIVLAVMCLGAMGLVGCTEDKLIEIAVKAEMFEDWPQNSTSVSWDNTRTVDIGEKVDEALAGTKYSRSDITGAVLNGVSYGVTVYEQSIDWVVGGSVLVQRMDPTAGPETTLLLYTDESIPGSLGKVIVADLVDAGVDVINAALKDFLAGGNPVLQVIVRNGSVTSSSGPPAPGNPIIFTWGTWIQYQILVSDTVNLPDPI